MAGFYSQRRYSNPTATQNDPKPAQAGRETCQAGERRIIVESAVKAAFILCAAFTVF